MLTVQNYLAFPKALKYSNSACEKESQGHAQLLVLLFNKSRDKQNLFIMPTFAKLSGCVITNSHRKKLSSKNFRNIWRLSRQVPQSVVQTARFLLHYLSRHKTRQKITLGHGRWLANVQANVNLTPVLYLRKSRQKPFNF